MERSYFNKKGMKCPYNKKKNTFEVHDSLPMPQKHADKEKLSYQPVGEDTQRALTRVMRAWGSNGSCRVS